jgi:hypothetical protein
MLEISNHHHFVCHAALHELDPVFKRFSFSESVVSLFSSLGYKRPAVMQSMYIFKVDLADCFLLAYNIQISLSLVFTVLFFVFLATRYWW